MTRPWILVIILLSLTLSIADAGIVETSFHVKSLRVNRLCKRQVITAVNGSLPGPTLKVKEGDTVVVHVFNKSPYNLTIHWHGVFQRQTPWADGPHYITQCPIMPGNSYTYKFHITGQEGTLWWHAHVRWLRATVYGALLIRPTSGHKYPFPKPFREHTILLGEWWNANPMDVEDAALAAGVAPNISEAYTINGWPGDLYSCPSKKTYKLEVVQGKTYLLRIINAALTAQFFFKIANHNMTVVAVDAAYTAPYSTDVILIAPGQTTDVLLTTDISPGSYYMAARPYLSAVGVVQVNNSTTTAILSYKNISKSSPPLLPALPALNDTPTAYTFSSNLTALTTSWIWSPVPLKVDENMFITISLGLSPCRPNQICVGPFVGQQMSASMNNHSFVLPSTTSILQAHFHEISGIYTPDFPNQPPLIFDYTNASNSFNPSLLITPKSTSIKRVKFNSTVQIVFQNTALIGVEEHPMHLHGHNFYVLAQGFGNYDAVNDPKKFNLVNPQERNTIGVPVGGWAVIRFRANNPGAWMIHCHLDVHLSWGFATTLIVENGGTPETMVPPPPADLPKC
uniref:laccase-7-like n=1 Tax=Erigeron canadensis TaxID=72917 RepID=UPI001CB97D0D|nr:laccase-7-like [Erigeron canadensis]